MSNPVVGAIATVKSSPLKALVIGLIGAFLAFFLDAKTKGKIRATLAGTPFVGKLLTA